MTNTLTPIDVWLKFDSETDEEPTYEANTFKSDSGYVIEWYHVDVGLVTQVERKTYPDCELWYEVNGFVDYTT